MAAIMVFLFHQQVGLAARQYSTDFFDFQARSWLSGDWSIDIGILQVEGISTAHGYQMYFGPFPAVLRLPVVSLSERFDGYLAQPSMLLASVVFVGSTVALWWQTRRLVQGDRPLGRMDKVATIFAVVMCSAGTLYLTVVSSFMVYSEAISWGVALTLLTCALLLAAWDEYRHRIALVASLAAIAAVSSRLTVGVGALLALWMTAGIWWLAHAGEGRVGRLSLALRRWAVHSVPTLQGRHPRLSEAMVWTGGAAAATLSYVIVNWIRFSQWFSIPWENYDYNKYSSARLAVLEANNGSLTGVDFVPTTMWHYLRPDGLMFDDRFPWVNFPRRSALPIGNVTLDADSPSSSFTAAMPLFVVLSLVAVGWLLLRRRESRGAAPLRLLLLSTAAGCGGMLLSGFLAHRYMADALPFLIIGAFTGFHVLAAAVTGRRGRAVGAVLLAAASVWGMVVNTALSVEYQKLVFPNTERSRYEFIRFQHAGGNTSRVMKSDVVPAPDVRGTLLIVEECQALLWSTGNTWMVLEGRVLDRNWRPDPGDRYFDLDIEPPRFYRAPLLCPDLLADLG